MIAKFNLIFYVFYRCSNKYEIEQIDVNNWEKLSSKEQVAEFYHTMNGTDNSFRMIVVKKDITPMLPTLEEILTDDEKLQYAKELYYCIATNDNDLTPQEVIKNFIDKEVKQVRIKLKN
jgi:hypothetical protein